MISLNTNIQSMFAAFNFNKTSSEIGNLTEQLATGKRINKASDDPAGMGIVSSLTSDKRGYQAVQKNISAANSLLEVAGGSLATQQELLQEMKSLATEASSDLLTADQRAAVSAQFVELQTQLTESVDNATMFGQNLTGTAAADVDVQSGIEAGDTRTLTGTASDAASLGVDAATIDLTDTTTSAAALTAIDTAIGTVSVNQATIGAQMVGLEKVGEFSSKMEKNLSASISRIEDVDVADASAKLAQLQAKLQIQAQMLSMSNQLPAVIISLLR